MNLPRIKTELILESWGNIAVTERFRERTFRSEQNTKLTFFNEMLADMADETKTKTVYKYTGECFQFVDWSILPKIWFLEIQPN